MARHKFPIGNNHNLGRRWKIKDTSKMRGQNGFKPGNTINLGRVRDDETKRKIGESQKGMKRGPTSEATKQKLKASYVNNPNRKFKDTSIELKIEAELQSRGLKYEKQKGICKIAIVDFYLPDHKIVIECDGDYWHSFPDVKEKDERKTTLLTENGFRVYRFTGTEIENSPKECLDRIII